ncbi:MAG: hypothetical protein KJ630_08100 [Proteobacteria bacterium]|nr:hypothetical protein [Pseudomonadota bacterium]
MQLAAGDWTEIFKAGDYGTKGSYTDADLDRMVANFNASDQVPIVVGHPQTDSPAWGWLTEIKRAGSVLMAKVGELHKDFAQALAENKFRNRSVRIAKTATGPKLLHLGFLGAVLPQVEGLKTTTRFAGDGGHVDYGFDLAGDQGQEGKTQEDDMDKDAQIKKLEADLAAEKIARQAEKDAAAKTAAESRQAEFAAFVESEMIAEGKLPKDRKDEVIGFMTSLPTGAAADFSVETEGNTKKTFSPVLWFKDFVKGLPTADFTRQLPDGVVDDFGRPGTQKTKLVDLSHKV